MYKNLNHDRPHRFWCLQEPRLLQTHCSYKIYKHIVTLKKTLCKYNQ